MNKAAKILIVAALVVAVAIIIALKLKTRQPAPQPPDTTSHLSPESALTSTPQENTVKHNLPRLIDLGADKCVFCKMMAPILAEIKQEYKDKLDVVFIDVWKNPDEAKKYNIHLIPTQIFFDASGKELFRHEAFFSKEDILHKFKELGLDLQE